jgi:hypothetical protein
MKTTVEWLEHMLLIVLNEEEFKKIKFSINQAKEMEKQQIIEACSKWQQEQDKKCFHPLPYRLSKSDVNYECTLCGKFI